MSIPCFSRPGILPHGAHLSVVFLVGWHRFAFHHHGRCRQPPSFQTFPFFRDLNRPFSFSRWQTFLMENTYPTPFSFFPQPEANGHPFLSQGSFKATLQLRSLRSSFSQFYHFFVCRCPVCSSRGYFKSLFRTRNSWHLALSTTLIKYGSSKKNPSKVPLRRRSWTPTLPSVEWKRPSFSWEH